MTTAVKAPRPTVVPAVREAERAIGRLPPDSTATFNASKAGLTAAPIASGSTMARM
jgi:hypothetical protein